MLRRRISGGAHSPQSDFAHSGGSLPARKSERFGKFDVTWAQGNPLTGGRHVHQFFAVNPRFDPSLGDPQANAIPATLLQVDELGGLIFRGIHAVEAGDADQRTAPAADDQAAKGVTHRHGESTKKVAAGDAHGVEGQFVVQPGKVVGPIDAGKRVAGVQYHEADLASDFAVAGKVGLAPARERFAIEERLPTLAFEWGGRPGG